MYVKMNVRKMIAKKCRITYTAPRKRPQITRRSHGSRASSDGRGAASGAGSRRGSVTGAAMLP
jgi:hypothetical protein